MLQQANQDLSADVQHLQTVEGAREAAREQLGVVDRGEQRVSVMPPAAGPLPLPGGWPYDAILDAGTAKMRPVSMVVITTVLGMIPLVVDPFFGAMAVCIMFGLSFAAVLSLLVTPVFYAIFFNVDEDSDARTALTDKNIDKPVATTAAT